MWMPIESAPKDGTQILVTGRWKPFDHSPGGEPAYAIMSWSSYMSDGTGHQWIIGSGSMTGSPWPATGWNVNFTHWRPLPEPPPTDNRSGTPEGEDAW